MVVVVVETALANGDGAGTYGGADRISVTSRIEGGRIVRMDARRREHEPMMFSCQLHRAPRIRDGGAYADDRAAPALPGTGNDRVAIGVERRISEMSVAVDEGKGTDVNSHRSTRRARRP